MIHKVYQVEANDYDNAGRASSDIKKTLKSLGVHRYLLKAVAIACYEAEINIVIHSHGGSVTLDVFDDGIVQLKFDDIGPGIPDLELALTPGWSTASPKARNLGFGAGMGLCNMKGVANTFDIHSSSEGTHITMTFQ